MEIYWERLEKRVEEETNIGVLEHLVEGALSPVVHVDPVRVERVLLQLIARFGREEVRHCRLRKAAAGHFAVLWVGYSRAGTKSVVGSWVCKPARHHEGLREILGRIRGAFVVGLDREGSGEQDAQRERALGLVGDIVDSVGRGLAVFYERESPSERERDDAGVLAQVMDQACLGLYFSTGAGEFSNESEESLSEIDLTRFLAETAAILRIIGDYGTPHTVFYLVQLLESMVPAALSRS